MKFLAWLFGYTSAAHALEAGLTHHASYHGLPVWMGDVGDASPLVYAKLDVLEWLIPVISALELFFQHAAGVPPELRGFDFVVKDPINPPTGADRAR